MIQAKNALFCFVAAAALLVDARSVFSAVSVDGVSQGHAVGVRVPSTNAPITDINSDDLICNTNFIQPVSDTVIKVVGGDTVTAQVGIMLDVYPVPRSQDALPCSSIAPLQAIQDLTPPTQLIPQTKVLYWLTCLKWFKIWEDGYDSTTHQWGSDHLYLDGGNATFTIPTCLPSGNYLLRAEYINLSSATFYPGAQFFMSCAQLSITSSTTALETPATVSFPGAYTIADPGIITSIFGISSYTPPGPDVFTC
ncbi:glycoside hydrolase family 61 protein G [Armillaria mellea]|nr:glycoside hydrolase family 61 protein G [Armillaria mellea]